MLYAMLVVKYICKGGPILQRISSGTLSLLQGLFSATLNKGVSTLVHVALRNPVTITVTDKDSLQVGHWCRHVYAGWQTACSAGPVSRPYTKFPAQSLPGMCLRYV